LVDAVRNVLKNMPALFDFEELKEEVDHHHHSKHKHHHTEHELDEHDQ
jgi:hypothetical protein